MDEGAKMALTKNNQPRCFVDVMVLKYTSLGRGYQLSFLLTKITKPGTTECGWKTGDLRVYGEKMCTKVEVSVERLRGHFQSRIVGFTSLHGVHPQYYQ